MCGSYLQHLGSARKGEYTQDTHGRLGKPRNTGEGWRCPQQPAYSVGCDVAVIAHAELSIKRVRAFRVVEGGGGKGVIPVT